MIIPCVCPGARHPDGDTVTLRERLSFADIAATKNALGVMYLQDEDAGIADVLAVLSERYVLCGIESWSLEEVQDGKVVPIPVTRPNIRTYILADYEVGRIVADAADDLYAGAVTRPLLQMASISSPSGPMDDSTSAPTSSPDGSTSKTPEASNPTPSSPSSITTIRTAGTATTSSPPAGVSRSSQNSASVA